MTWTVILRNDKGQEEFRKTYTSRRKATEAMRGIRSTRIDKNAETCTYTIYQ